MGLPRRASSYDERHDRPRRHRGPQPGRGARRTCGRARRGERRRHRARRDAHGDDERAGPRQLDGQRLHHRVDGRRGAGGHRRQRRHGGPGPAALGLRRRSARGDLDVRRGVRLMAGHGSVAVPGAWSGMGTAHERHGRVDWSEVLAPRSRRRARATGSGRLPRPTSRSSGTTSTGGARTAPPCSCPGPGRRGGRAHPRRAARADLRAHRAGRLARRLHRGHRAADGRRHGRPRRPRVDAGPRALRGPGARPLRLDVGAWDLATNPPPSVGGPMLALMLGALTRRARADWSDIIDIQRRVLGYRVGHHDVSPDLEEAGWRPSRPPSGTAWPGCRPRRAPRTSRSPTPRATPAPSPPRRATARGGRARHRPAAQQLAGRARAQPPRGARPAPGARSPRTWRRRSAGPRRPGARHRVPGADRITTALMQVLGQGCLHEAPLQQAVDAPACTCRSAGRSAARSSPTTRATRGSRPRSPRAVCPVTTTARARCTSAGGRRLPPRGRRARGRRGPRRAGAALVTG